MQDRASVELRTADGHTVATFNPTVCQLVEGLLRSELDLVAEAREAEGGRMAFIGYRAG